MNGKKAFAEGGERGYAKDSEACGKIALEIIEMRRLKVWMGVFQDLDDEAKFVGWLATWACHWANKQMEWEARDDRKV